MKIPFGNGSCVNLVRLSWDMWYPWVPPYQHYDKEPGLQIHLSPADASNVSNAISAAIAAAGAATGIGAALGAFGGIIANVISRLVLNGDGSMDISMSAHGFQVGSGPAGDPNVWLAGLWGPVAAALNALGQAEPMMIKDVPQVDLKMAPGKLLAVAPI